MTVKEREIVVEGWNAIGKAYHDARNVHKIDGELEQLVEMLPEHAEVLDAGSGSGVPVSRYLDEAGLKVTGIDLSDTMLELASKNVPGGTFLKKDITSLDFEPESFDGIVCVYALFHVPKRQHGSIFKDFYKILRGGGILMMNTGVSEWEGVTQFFGVPMFWSNHAPSRTLELAKNAGFSILFEGKLVRGGEHQYWIFAKKE